MTSYQDAVRELMHKAEVDQPEAERLMEEAIQRAIDEKRVSPEPPTHPATDEDMELIAE